MRELAFAHPWLWLAAIVVAGLGMSALRDVWRSRRVTSSDRLAPRAYAMRLVLRDVARCDHHAAGDSQWCPRCGAKRLPGANMGWVMSDYAFSALQLDEAGELEDV